MQISLFKNYSNYNCFKNQSVSHPTYSKNLTCDTITFGAKKRVDVKDIDFRSKFSEEDLEIIGEIADYANITGVNIYLVGGIVRDMLLGKEANDIDFIVEGDALSFAKGLSENNDNVRINYLKNEFGTSQIKINGQTIDLASTREESYIRKAMPTVRNIGCSMDKDVIRRDFSINAIALKVDKDENGNVFFRVVDKTNGVDDLNEKKLRVNYPRSFEDDPTRIIRGLRFRLKFGFEYDSKTQKLQEQYLKNPPRELISQARVITTLRKLFADKEMAPKAFSKYISEGIYKLSSDKTNAQPSWGYSISQSCELFEIDDFTSLYMSALDNDKTSELLGLYEKDEQLSNFEIYNRMKKLSKNDLALYWAITKDENALKYYNELKEIKPFINGKMLIDLGYPRGKQIGELLTLLLKEKLNNSELKTLDDELQFISSLNIV